MNLEAIMRNVRKKLGLGKQEYMKRMPNTYKPMMPKMPRIDTQLQNSKPQMSKPMPTIRRVRRSNPYKPTIRSI